MAHQQTAQKRLWLSAAGTPTPQKKRRLSANTRALHVGTDCSGMDVCVAMLEEIIAERQLRYAVEHVFSSEVDPSAREIIEYNFSPKYLYNDLTKRALYPSGALAASQLPAASELCGLDIYVAGFPMPTWVFSREARRLHGRERAWLDLDAHRAIHHLGEA